MFNWLKGKKSTLTNWDFEDLADFEIIQNRDSVQYASKDGTKVIYFSLLNVSGGDVFSIDLPGDKPTIIENAAGWQLKGMKKSGSQILVCVVSVSEKDDIEWAQTFFDSITPHTQP